MSAVIVTLCVIAHLALAVLAFRYTLRWRVRAYPELSLSTADVVLAGATSLIGPPLAALATRVVYADVINDAKQRTPRSWDRVKRWAR